MTIDIKGHSGCDIDIIENDNQLLIRKSSKSKKYLDRLYQQGLKQQNDKAALNCDVKVPKIHELIKGEDETYIIMDYIYAKNFVDYFEQASRQDIDHFVKTFEEYVDNEIEQCTVETVKRDVFVNKMESIIENCMKNEILTTNALVNMYVPGKVIVDNVNKVLEKSMEVFKNLPDEIRMPVGICHGDLTFSNILFTSNNFYFIDYLDSFIETPIQDIVKLRQDTKYFWSTMMYNKKYDPIRLKMIFEYIDNKIDDYFKNNEYYNDTYNVLQLMNILRIVPYVKEVKVRDFLVKVINNILKNYE
ncbi:MAG: phosphotransferase [Clostridia bacterium]|nr:phosphotransferase [Clostridia bacterium]